MIMMLLHSPEQGVSADCDPNNHDDLKPSRQRGDEGLRFGVSMPEPMRLFCRRWVLLADPSEFRVTSAKRRRGGVDGSCHEFRGSWRDRRTVRPCEPDAGATRSAELVTGESGISD